MSNIQQANQQLSDSLRKIDQLTQANQQLTQQNNQLTQDLNKEKTTNQHLKSVNDKKEEENRKYYAKIMELQRDNSSLAQAADRKLCQKCTMNVHKDKSYKH
jgi:uncharacterized protein YigA (DUF484 family)